MSEVKIKELDKSLIHQANSNSMSGKRGDISAHEYEAYCQKVMSWNIPDSRKQFLSTPSARRATQKPCNELHIPPISIHALREEGDRSILLL